MNYRGEPDHVVEDSTKVMEAVSQQRGEFGEWWPSNFGDVPNTVDHPRPFRIWLRDGFIGSHIAPSLDDLFYRAQVFARPCELTVAPIGSAVMPVIDGSNRDFVCTSCTQGSSAVGSRPKSTRRTRHLTKGIT